MGDQVRWPRGTPVAPSGKGPGGGRFRDQWVSQVVQTLGVGGVPAFHPRVQATARQIRALQAAAEHFYRHRRDYMALKKRSDAIAALGEGGEALAERVHVEASIDFNFSEYAARHGATDEAGFKRGLAAELRRLWADKKIAIRTDTRSLDRILADRRYRTIHDEDVRGFGLISASERGFHEEMIWGYDEDSDPEIRPVYGYLVGGTGVNDEAVEKYGEVQIVLKDSVRPRTTAMFGDSLDHLYYGMPSAIDNPGWQSWTFGTGTDDQDALYELGRARVPGDIYVEAQIHGGVHLKDIEKVVFPYEPPTPTQRLLRAKRIPWEVAS